MTTTQLIMMIIGTVFAGSMIIVDRKLKKLNIQSEARNFVVKTILVIGLITLVLLAFFNVAVQAIGQEIRF